MNARTLAAFAAFLTVLAKLHLAVPAGRAALSVPSHLEVIATALLIAAVLAVIAVAVCIVRSLREPMVQRNLPRLAQYSALLERGVAQ